MQIDERRMADVVVIGISGDITLNKGGDLLLRAAVRGAIQQGARKLVVDLGQASYVDSAGLGELVQAQVTTKNAGGSLKLARVPPRLTNLLTLTKLASIFETYDTETDAVSSFAPVA